MGLYNFVKIHPGHEKNIYNAPVNILDNTERDSERRSQQSDSTWINSMRDRMANYMWED